MREFMAAIVGDASVFRMVPLGNRKLITVTLRSNLSSWPALNNVRTRFSTSPWETTAGGGPAKTCEPANVVEIWPAGKYCTITLFRFWSDMDAAKAVSIDCVSLGAQAFEPPT